MILETKFETSEGICEVIDFMVYGDKDPTIVRMIKGIEGKVELETEITVRFDYGNIVPWIMQESDKKITAIGGVDALTIYAPVTLKRDEHDITSTFSIAAGETKSFLMFWSPSHLRPQEVHHTPHDMLERTHKFWKDWIDKCQYKGFAEDSVKRSLTVLKALTYKPTGAIIAAPTTSLPECIGSGRNWDYRFSWIRDSSYALLALLKAGYREEAMAWQNWLLRAVAGTPDQTNIMYGIRGERRLPEIELPWLAGYENSQPVRVGNGAYDQFQLDVYGEMLSMSYIARKEGIDPGEHAWKIEKNIISYVENHWHEPDHGIWEMRGGKKHFTHSKLMAWEALNCALKMARHYGLEGDTTKWEELKNKIHRDICKNGYNEKLKSFVQYYGSDELDASLLMMGRVGFLPCHDPRIIGTVEAIKNNLMKDGLVMRYRPESRVDGMHEDEGSFLPCSFWLVDNLRLMDKKDEALELFNYLESLRNDLGLLSEEYDSKNKRQVGNFPQGFSHIAHAISAMGFEHKVDDHMDK